ncbi:MAG: serine/threonine-protein kinase [Bryobacteraceae bacterium]|jgi:serine/threonine-protein kinase
MEFSVGSSVGDYQIIEILGAGGMGKVYKVRNVISDRVEAMKVLLPDLGNAPDLADRFLREIKVQASLEHPNIAALHTALRLDNQLLMLMEMVEGETLEHKLKAGPIPIPLAVDYIRQVLSALEYAHARGVVHRDIKPANMMLTPSGVVKLMDFGIAKASGDHKLTMTGTTLGSLYYMSPEQIKGAATLDARADLYSVGVSLYELATGKRPFDGDSQFAIMAAHLEKVPLPPIALDPAMPQALNDAILMAVVKDPNARFQTATAFRNALGSVPVAGTAAGLAATVAASAMPLPAPPQPVAIPAPAYMAAPAPAQAPARRSHRGWWMALGGLAAAAAVVAAIQFGPWHASKAATGNASPQVTSAPPSPAPAEAAGTGAPAAANPEPVQPPASASPSSSVPLASTQATTPRTAAPAVHFTAPAPTGAAAPAPAQDAPAAVESVPRRVPEPIPGEKAVQPRERHEVHEETVAVDQRALREQREFHRMLAARATVVRASLRPLEESQKAHGMNLRGDIREAQSLMDAYLESATEDLNQLDLPAARTDMEKAERQIEKLEKFLGR